MTMEKESKGKKEFTVKLYESGGFDQFLGETLRPGGLELTTRIAELGGFGESSTILDIACGKGASAFFLTRNYGCMVFGIDLSRKMIGLSQDRAEEERLKEKIAFAVADGEDLPFLSSTFDGIVSECSFSILPDKKKALKEMKRVLRPKGKLVMTDMTIQGEVSEEFRDQLTFLPCASGAETIEGYVRLLEEAGFKDYYTEDHSGELKKVGFQMFLTFGSIENFLWSVASACCAGNEAASPNDTFLDGFKKLFSEKILGYALITATRP